MVRVKDRTGIVSADAVFQILRFSLPVPGCFIFGTGDQKKCFLNLTC
jgi:hypothetical protein